MAFSLFHDLFGKIDDVTQTYVADIASSATSAIAPVVTVGLTLTFIAFGILIIRGGVQMPLSEFLGKSLRVGLICGVALAGGLYQGQIADVIRTTPDALASSLVSDPSGAPQEAATMIDTAAEEGFNKANEAFEQMSWMDPGQGLVFLVFGFVVAGATVVFVAIGGAFLLLSKLALAVLAGVGPIFIVAMLWQPTSRFFEVWVGQVVNFILLAVLLAASFGLMLSIYTGFLEGVSWEADTNNLYNVGGVLILTVAMGIVLLQLPGVASALGGGASVGYLYELKALAGGAKSMGAAAAGARDRAGAAGAGMRAAHGAGAAGGGAAAQRQAFSRGAAAYYKGRKAA